MALLRWVCKYFVSQLLPECRLQKTLQQKHSPLSPVIKGQARAPQITDFRGLGNTCHRLTAYATRDTCHRLTAYATRDTCHRRLTVSYATADTCHKRLTVSYATGHRLTAYATGPHFYLWRVKNLGTCLRLSRAQLAPTR